MKIEVTTQHDKQTLIAVTIDYHHNYGNWPSDMAQLAEVLLAYKIDLHEVDKVSGDPDYEEAKRVVDEIFEQFDGDADLPDHVEVVDG